MAVPVQEFQIGQRVQVRGQKPFVIRQIYYSLDGHLIYGPGSSFGAQEAFMLTLAPESPPYVPSERLVRPLNSLLGGCPQNYRCETDDEMAARHTVERAEYDRLGADDGGTP